MAKRAASCRRFLDPPHAASTQVFGSPTPTRRRIILATLSLLGAVCLLTLWSFVTPGLSAQNMPHGTAVAEETRMAGRLGLPQWPSAAEAAPPSDPAGRGGQCGPTPGPAGATSSGPHETIYGFLPFDEDWNYLSLQVACHGIDVLLPEWFRLSPAGLQLLGTETDPQAPKQRVLSLIAHAAHRFSVMPVVTVSDAPEAVNARVLAGGLPGRDAIAALVQLALHDGYRGYCVDLSEYDPAAIGPLDPFLGKLHAALAADGLKTCIAVGADRLQSVSPAVLAKADKVVVKAFRGAEIGGPPTALQPKGAVEHAIAAARKTIPPARLVVALGTGAADWAQGTTRPEALTFQATMQRIDHLHGRIDFDAKTMNPRASYAGTDGTSHRIWLLDAVTTYNGMRTAMRMGIPRVAIWGIGREDPSIWTLLGTRDLSPGRALGALSSINLGNLAAYYGTGPLLHVETAPRLGVRPVAALWGAKPALFETYRTLPLPYVVKRWGNAAPKTVALTFDDGPDPVYTPKILDVLAAHGAKATFFQIGQSMLVHPALVRQVLRSGNEIGSHTFFHPHMAEVSDYRIRTELDMQNRLAIAETGHKLALFRPPYMRGLGPLAPERLHKLKLVDSLGYTITASQIVVPDWKVRSPAELADYVVGQVTSGKGAVIQMHDGGGDRSATVAALPQIIDRLHALGYRFGTVSNLVRTRQAAAPRRGWLQGGLLDDGFFFLARNLAHYLVVLLAIGILLGVARSLGLMSLLIARRRSRRADPAFLPPVSVLVPAYNEQDVIVQTVRSILASDYPDLEVICIDDGSTDATAARCREAFAHDTRVRVVSQPNGGKWRALNTGVWASDRRFVVCIDADTVIDPQAIRRLMPHFADPRVGGVAGNVKVGNRHNLVTRLQALEYVVSQNVERRALDRLNAIAIVPGALGAWRVRALQVVGGYSDDTLAEDADLTMSVARAKYRIAFEEAAIAHTEAPGRVRQLMRQRLRWTLGTMQAAWKHRRALRECHPLGFVALPDLVVFGVLVCLVAPVIDALILANLLAWAGTLLAATPAPSPGLANMVLLSYLFLPLLDAFVAWLAFRHERGEDRRLLWLLPLTKIFYRQLLYIAVIRATWRAGTGRLASWGKIERSAKALGGAQPAKATRTAGAGTAGAKVRQPVSVKGPTSTGKPRGGLRIAA